MTKTEALQLIARLCAAFPGRPISQDSVELFVEKLTPIPLDQARPGVENAIDACKWFPSWFELSSGMRLESPTERFERIKRQRGLDDEWQLKQRQLVQRWDEHRENGGRRPRTQPDHDFVQWYEAMRERQGR